MNVLNPLYRVGDFVGIIERSKPVEPPIPERWHLLLVHAHRELKVMKTFEQRDISGWVPMQTTMHDVTRYRRGYEWIERRNVISPLISGVIIIPDFETSAERWREVDGVIGIHRMGQCVPFLTQKDMMDLRNIEKIGNTPKSKRERLFEIGELVRVVNGPFRQFCARVERFDSRGRLSVGVDIFGRITPIEVSESDIEAV